MTSLAFRKLALGVGSMVGCIAVCSGVSAAAEEVNATEISQVLPGEELTESEANEFREYLEREEAFESAVVKSPSVVASPTETVASLHDSYIVNPAGINKNDRQPFEAEKAASEYSFAGEDSVAYLPAAESNSNVVSGVPEGTLQSTPNDAEVETFNPTKTVDNRIGALYWKDGLSASVGCTANHIGGKFWLTAHHCVDGRLNGIGFIQQSDGDFAGVEAIYTKSSKYDVALIKVGSGITSGTFDLSSTRANIGQTLSLVGYGTVNSYSSKSTLSVVDHPAYVDLRDSNKNVHRYYDKIKSTPILPDKYMPTGGDSGAAVWDGNSLYGVHSGSNSGYDGLQGSDAFHSNTVPHIAWIKETMNKKSNSSIAEKYRAFRGGIAEGYPRYNGGNDYDLIGSSR